MASLNFQTLDVFTTTRYTGNPVSIISLPSEPTLTQAQKQAIAAEFNLSEIVFLYTPSPLSTLPPDTRKIDIFTSLAEVPFAGHPTIGSAWYLLNLNPQSPPIKQLLTKAGPIPISYDRVTNLVSASIPQDFHIHEATISSSLTPGKNHQIASIVKGMSFIYVELANLDDLKKAAEIGNLNKATYNPGILDEGWRVGLVGTMYFVPVPSTSEDGVKKYRTRMFGSREDPGTGSASSGLGCLLASREEEKGRFKYGFEQGVEMGRKNDIFVEVETGGNGIEEVVLSGRGVSVMKGTLEV